MEPTKIYLEDGQPREKVGTAKGTATYYKNGDIDFKAYAQGEPQQLDVVKKGQSSCYRTTGKEPKRVRGWSLTKATPTRPMLFRQSWTSS